MKPNWYEIITGCVEEGARAAVRLANDHDELTAPPGALETRIYDEIMARLCAVIVWEDDV